MKMRSETLIPIRLEGTDLFLSAPFGSVGLFWPTSFDYQGKTYLYQSNEIMSPFISNFYGGYAKYSEV